jgi:tetratricopeptide (TPR) repeat protein
VLKNPRWSKKGKKKDMGKACSSCGAMAAPEARFCRLCGAPLRFADAGEGSVSPLAQTVPLSGEGRPTDAFPTSDPKRSAETGRVRREEIERLLHRPSIEQTDSGDDYDGPIIIPVVSDFVAPNTSELTPRPAAEKASPPSPARTRRPRQFFIAATLGALLLVVAVSLTFLVPYWRAPEPTSSVPENLNGGEPQASVEAQLNEAQSLLASGETSLALTRLRALVRREPSNALAHRLLGEALSRSGSRRDAIAEYSAATRLDEKDAVAWRALASTQFGEDLYADAVESYRRLIALTGEDGIDDNARLEYADALRLAGYTEDARAVYRKVEAGASADLARQATKHLSELTPAKQTAIASNVEPAHATESPARETRTEPSRSSSSSGSRPSESPSAPAASPSPALASATQAPTEAVSKNSVAETDPDAYYFQAISIINGREPKNLPRPELLRALQLLQNAANARGGAHREQAQKYAERLGREFDRRPRQK